jgi:hypothetical protein
LNTVCLQLHVKIIPHPNQHPLTNIPKNEHATWHKVQLPQITTSSHVITSGYTPMCNSLIQCMTAIPPNENTYVDQFSPQTVLNTIQPSGRSTPHKINRNSPITFMWPHHFITVLLQIDWFVHFWSVFCTHFEIGFYAMSYLCGA